ncbi:hypothetical protein VFPPC_17118 [Pochonia chlamydosporia 170]|uniref:Uncharacterized protein n=1 Tax=Pochonia chlamydosporia 170 TaxID=1380566 RepID=A0A179EWY8_METCM|nr:hypothetical protein VFPPC_17118 [Pochonia chlamydosporia 170]OAQ57681.1 hypothetical protein VFPPC_17118 [Pochonia chlamydosporia 170]
MTGCLKRGSAQITRCNFVPRPCPVPHSTAFLRHQAHLVYDLRFRALRIASNRPTDVLLISKPPSTVSPRPSSWLAGRGTDGAPQHHLPKANCVAATIIPTCPYVCSTLQSISHQ